MANPRKFILLLTSTLINVSSGYSKSWLEVWPNERREPYIRLILRTTNNVALCAVVGPGAQPTMTYPVFIKNLTLNYCCLSKLLKKFAVFF
jgi:hypothetical protein